MINCFFFLLIKQIVQGNEVEDHAMVSEKVVDLPVSGTYIINVEGIYFYDEKNI